MDDTPHDHAIARAILGIASPFFASGELRLGAPVRLRFTDGEELVVAPAANYDAQVDANAPLAARAKPAHFGKGLETRYDRSVRDGAQIAASEFTLDGVDLEAMGVLESARATLSPDDPTPIIAEPYALHLYERGGRFEPHKDTPTGRDMIGSLVLCLPSRFRGGALQFSHAGHIESLRWATHIEDDPAPDVLRWVAFFGDVDHRVDWVGEGSRVTITYRLSRKSKSVARTPLAPSQREEPLVQALTRALSDKTWLPAGERVAVPCVHMYSSNRAIIDAMDDLAPEDLPQLKGRDAVVASAAMQLGLRVALRPIVYTNAQEEALWELPTYPTRVRLRDRSDPDDITNALPEGTTMHSELGFLLRPPGSFEYYVKAPSGAEAAAKTHLGGIDYSATGYFGNEGGYGEFYLYSALVIDVPRASKRKRAPERRSPKRVSAKEAAKPSRPAPRASTGSSRVVSSANITRNTKSAIDAIVARFKGK